MKPEARINTVIGRYRLTGARFNGLWSFYCSTFTDLPLRYDGATDASECIETFERRATEATTPAQDAA